MKRAALPGALATLIVAGAAFAAEAPADLVIKGGSVWSVDPESSRAEAVAVTGGRISFVGSALDAEAFIEEGRTRIIEVPADALVLPGFIDNHVHFTSAGSLLLGLNLLEVNDADGFRRAVLEASARLPEGAWLTGGEWGAYAAWAKSSAGAGSSEGKGAALVPSKELIDDATGGRPALIRRFDRKVFLASTLALDAAGIDADTPNPAGGEIVREASGEATGLLRGTAGDLVARVVPDPSYEQRLAEARRALLEARRFGVTTLHDNTANREQLDLLRDLRSRGELTSRFWARMRLEDWEEVRAIIEKLELPALEGGWGDDMIRLGGLKAWVDGIMGNSSALFFEPYDHEPESYGRLRHVMAPEGNLYRLIRDADRAGFTVTVHAIGDRGNRILLDTYERVFRDNPPRDRRFRVVHAQVVDAEDFARFGRLGLIAEVQPYHCIDDMRWMEERIGDRSRYAYAFRDLLNGGAAMSFGSDWPGTNASYYPINPLLGIYAAVTRQTLDGEPEGGWYPKQRLSIEQAVRFFTIGNAYASFEEHEKGSIEVGKLADLTVIDRDILERPAEELREARVLFTLLAGKVVYSAEADE